MTKRIGYLSVGYSFMVSVFFCIFVLYYKDNLSSKILLFDLLCTTFISYFILSHDINEARELVVLLEERFFLTSYNRPRHFIDPRLMLKPLLCFLMPTTIAFALMVYFVSFEVLAAQVASYYKMKLFIKFVISIGIAFTALHLFSTITLRISRTLFTDSFMAALKYK